MTESHYDDKNIDIDTNSDDGGGDEDDDDEDDYDDDDYDDDDDDDQEKLIHCARWWQPLLALATQADCSGSLKIIII